MPQQKAIVVVDLLLLLELTDSAIELLKYNNLALICDHCHKLFFEYSTSVIKPRFLLPSLLIQDKATEIISPKSFYEFLPRPKAIVDVDLLLLLELTDSAMESLKIQKTCHSFAIITVTNYHLNATSV